VAEARQRWKAAQALLDATRLVFVDETGTSTKMVRTHGRCRPRRICFILSGECSRCSGPTTNWSAEGRMSGPVYRGSAATIVRKLAPHLAHDRQRPSHRANEHGAVQRAACRPVTRG
jgi:hypothetical protein